MPFTYGFRTNHARISHFRKHGADFGVFSPSHYESLADTFLGEPISQQTNPAACQGVRLSNGDMLRFNIATFEFGVLSYDGYIRTYYVPDVAIHRFPTHYEYFFDECLNQ